MAWERDLIEVIRKEKYLIGSSTKNTLAPDLHGALTKLSTELYQNGMHFIKEIIQNAEDNKYEEGVQPSLEFLLTNEDVAGMGASATLLVLNNEIGLTASDVDALCSSTSSTKKGKRNQGYIGCKGIGFKSVFMVCKTPIIISNGFRIRFQDEPSEEAGVGYIVPEWTESPTNEAILAACGHDELPTTVMILPLRQTKVALVREQLKDVSPEIILFLSKIREIKVSDKSDDISAFRGFSRTTSISARKVSEKVTQIDVFLSKVTLTIDRGDASDIHSYFVFQALLPVTSPIEERKEIKEWTIGLAFPQEERASSSHIGDVFSFLPTELRTGFPFIINADFLLTSSRESIMFDSEWNLGILDQIPVVFEAAFRIMLQPENNYVPDCRDTYKFLPVYPVENSYRYCSTGSLDSDRHLRQKLQVQPDQAAKLHELDKVRVKILEKLGKNCPILLSMAVFDGSPTQFWLPEPAKSLQIKPSFRAILISAAQSNHSAPSVVLTRRPDGSYSVAGKFAIVDEYIQKKYASGLAALGVPEMTSKQYESFLSDYHWLLNLPDKVYLQVLSFFAFEMKLLDQFSGDKIRLLKIRRESGAVELTSFSSLRDRKIDLFHTSSVKDAEWISAWAKEFSPWHSVTVIPSGTSQGLIEASNSYELKLWIKKHGSLTELSAENYAQQLIQKLMVANARQKSTIPARYSVLVLQFLYSGIHEKKLCRYDIVERLQSLRHVSVVGHNGSLDRSQGRSASLKMRDEGCVLLPQKVSKWPLLCTCFSRDHWNRHLIALSDDYLVPQCSLVKEIVNTSSEPDSMLSFIKESFSAVDLPSIKLPATESFPFHGPMTMEKSVLIFQWLKVFLPNRRTTKSEQENDQLLMSLKALDWLKTSHHGWQSPKSVFFSISYFENCFTAHDLPFVDVNAYDDLKLSGKETQLVFEELEVESDKTEARDMVAQYFSRRPAHVLDQETVNRFYAYLHEIGWSDEGVEIWVPARSTSQSPQWRAAAKCIMSDDLNIFEGDTDVTVLDKIYDASLLPFFSGVLEVPQRAAVDSYCEIWMKWSTVGRNTLYEVEGEDSYPKRSIVRSTLNKVKVEKVWTEILENWQEAKKSSKKIWKTFCSRAWVPVAPSPNEMANNSDQSTISIMAPRQVLWADDFELSKSFSAVANGQLSFGWLPPELSGEQLERVVKLYSQLGVQKLSEVVRHDACIPPNVWKTKVSPGERQICEGLLRSVLGYLCKNAKKYNLSVTDRQSILSRLTSAKEVFVSDPFEKRSNLHFETLTSPAIVTTEVFSHYDKVKGKFYYLKEDHTLLEGDVGKRDFNDQFAGMISVGILSEHPELVQGLTILLKLLWESRFATKLVEYEFKVQKLVIFAEDEKLLMENLATRT